MMIENIFSFSFDGSKRGISSKGATPNFNGEKSDTKFQKSIKIKNEPSLQNSFGFCYCYMNTTKQHSQNL